MDKPELYEASNSWHSHSFIKFVEYIDPNMPLKDIILSLPLSDRMGIKITPPSILEFVRTIIEKTACKKLYIPFATGIEVDEFRNIVSNVDYFTIDTDLRNLIQKKTGIPYTSEEAVNNTEYDMIYSDLPFSGFNNNSIQKKTVDDCIKKLSKDGYGIFTFADNIVYNEAAKKWLSDLAADGTFVTAVIDLPAGSYLPATMVSAKILVFTKQNTDKIFLAKINKDIDAPQIAEFFLSNTNSTKSEALGKWFDRNTFPDYASYENELRRRRTAAKLEKAYNGKMIPISEISTAVKAPKKNEPQFDEAENAVYIPKLGSSEVVTSLQELHIKPQNYFQILVDQEKILPGFLKFFFNTDNGVNIRERASAGYIPSLNTSRIKEIEVPVPSLKMQAAVLDAYAELNRIGLEVTRLKDRLESIPASYSNVAKEIKDINNRGDKFEQWLESLPYPLSTILKRYTAADTQQQKQDMLFYFFEAYSIFTAAILTAIYQQPQFSSFKIEEVETGYFAKASFGSWVMIDRALAKIFRSQLSDSNKIDTVLNGFHTDDQSLVKLICNSDIYSILDRTCEYRNTWKGHSGIASEDIYNDHVRALEGELRKLQETIKDLYEKFRLVRPVSLKRRHGEFINTVEILTGSNAIFKKDEIKGEALDEDKLYIQVLDTNETFELPPYFVMKNSPADVKNACYFYNRLEGSKSRYVSYHFEGKPEYLEDGEAAFDNIKTILDKTGS